MAASCGVPFPCGKLCPGPAGLQGPTGPTGPSGGPQGVTGPTGPIGPIGLANTQGGPTGPFNVNAFARYTSVAQAGETTNGTFPYTFLNATKIQHNITLNQSQSQLFKFTVGISGFYLISTNGTVVLGASSTGPAQFTVSLCTFTGTKTAVPIPYVIFANTATSNTLPVSAGGTCIVQLTAGTEYGLALSSSDLVQQTGVNASILTVRYLGPIST